MITIDSLITSATELFAEMQRFRDEQDGLCKECHLDLKNAVDDTAEIASTLRQVKHCQHGKGTVSI